ncbi:head-tail connector protein [Rhizobium sp. GN54]|uniref:head-tail connector protein n=1 Tax=Rhizobium sp. GN54 TaxID=2898150 RepID=UPI001E4CA7C9|nr:head-tail connector protein [Rhizobium sp. GN54]MCD2185223.1 head-tail connector protein [Rhizobium sp. GN54]
MSVIDLAAAKAHLSITDDTDDALIEAKIAAAENHVASYLGKPLSEFDPMPAAIPEAILQLVGHLYENREATLVGVTIVDAALGFFDLLAPHREWIF